MGKLQQDTFYTKIATLLSQSQQQLIQTVNHTMVNTYFEIGRMIVEEEQNGKERAGYGIELIKNLSTKLTTEFGRGFSKRNLELMRKFYSTYSNSIITKTRQSSIVQTLSAQSKIKSNNLNLSWSHYLHLIQISNVDERHFYEIEAAQNGWSVRELQRQFNSALYERLAWHRTVQKEE